MGLFDGFKTNTNGNFNRAAFKVLATFIFVMGLFIILSLLFPRVMAAVFSTIWVLFIVVTVIFFALGLLVVVGLRKEASRILDILMEGTLSFVDFLRFLNLVWLRFLELLREFILYIAPIVAYILALLVYTVLMIIYKRYGKLHDVTFFTVILTAVMVLVIGYLNKPSKNSLDFSLWWNKVKNVFHSSFIDGFEVILFIFFLTMDSTNLFFLPEDLNIPLKAVFKSYDFMIKSFVSDGHLKITLNIIVFTIIVEILRNLIRLFAAARKHYTNDILLFSDGLIASRATRVKNAIRKAFHGAKDDLVRFITFTTVLFGVFLVFPRLKLLTLATASVASLALDLIILDRLYFTQGRDLVSRLLGKLFKI